MKIRVTLPNGSSNDLTFPEGSTLTVNPPTLYDDGLGGKTDDPRKAWENGKCTVDPLTMAMTLAIVGPGGSGTEKLIRQYHQWYHEQYGWQCTAEHAGANREDRTKCEFAAIADAWKPPVLVPGV